MEDNQLLEHFKQIQNTLKNREEPVDIYKFAQKSNISIKQSKLLLNSFIEQTNALNDYIVIFSAQIITENKIKNIYFPSFSEKSEGVLSSDNLLDFGVFAIYRKDKEFMLNDFSVFCHDNISVPNITLKSLDRKENKLIANGSHNSSNFSKKPAQTVTSNPAAGNNIKQSNHSSSSVTTNKLTNQKNENKLAKAFNNKVSISNPTEVKVYFEEVDNTCGKIKVDDYGEESYYGGPPVKREAATEPGIQTKRKFVEDPELEQSLQSKKKKDLVNLGEKTVKSEGSNNVSGTSSINSNASINNNKNMQNEPPNKIKKTRRVKKTNTYIDEQTGYMRTVDEWEEEEYWTDEKQKPQVAHNYQAHDNRPKKATKKVAPGQSSLHSFFAK